MCKATASNFVPQRGGAGRGESRPAGSWKSGQICHRQTIRLCVLPRLPLIKLFALTKEAGRCVLEATSAEVPNGPIGRPVGGWRRSLRPPRRVLLASSGFPPLVSYKHPACFASPVRKLQRQGRQPPGRHSGELGKSHTWN